MRKMRHREVVQLIQSLGSWVVPISAWSILKQVSSLAGPNLQGGPVSGREFHETGSDVLQQASRTIQDICDHIMIPHAPRDFPDGTMQARKGKSSYNWLLPTTSP